jgi:multidrug efflux pump subunit AcrB
MLNLASRARPYFGAVVVTVVLLTAGGLYSATRMPRAVYPEVTFPRIAIVAKVAALDMATMEVKVTRPLEEAVSTVIGVAQVRSKTIRGASELSIDFNPGTDMRYAKEDTWNRISAIRSELPADVELTVEQMTPSVFPILSLVLTGGDSPTQLRDYAFYQLAPKIKNVPDVLYANVAGGDIREIEVEARPDDLLTAGLSAADLADQIGKLHLLQPVGRIERQPFAFQLLVNTQGTTARQIEELVIATRNNQPLHVRDVADVRILHQDRVLSIGYQGRDAVVITVFRRLGGNAANVARDVRALLVKEKPPANIQATVAYDQAAFVNTAVDNVRDAIVVGGVFSILILLAFLHGWRPAILTILAIPVALLLSYLVWWGALLGARVLLPAAWAATFADARGLVVAILSCLLVGAFAWWRGWRATVISAVALPTTLAITLLFLHWTGGTLNLMSLGGLAVAIGLIIDDTVVVMENIARHLMHAGSGAGAKSADPVDAASSEITGAVIGSTLTTVLVFVPLAFIVGVYGQFFASLSWALSTAVLVSMVISLTLVPVCAAKFLSGHPMPPPGRVYRFLEHLYDRGLEAALRFPWLTLGVSVAAVGLGIVLFTGIPDPRPPAAAAKEVAAPEKKGTTPRPPLVKGLETGLMPAMDEGAFILDYWAPSGTPLARTAEMAGQVEEILSKNPDVDAYVRRTGSENGIFATQTFRGDISVILRPAENDPVGLLKPIRPKLDDSPEGKKLAGLLKEPDGREQVRRKYRRRSASEVMDEVSDQVKDAFSEHQLKFETIPIMEDELNDLSGASRPIEVKLFGPDQRVLRQLADKLGELLEEKGKGRGLTEVNSNVLEGNPDLMIRVDGVRAAKYGLTPQEVQRQVQAMYLGQVATQVRESAVRITDVRVRYPDRVRFGGASFDPQRLLDQWLLLPDPAPTAPSPGTPSASPGLAGPARAVRLSAVAHVEAVRTPDEQWRENQQPAIFVTAELKPEEAGLNSVAADIKRWMADFPLPGKAYRWDLGGHYLRLQEASDSFVVVIIVAVLLVYIMLAFQFRSVVLPLLIFLTQPLSLVSGLLALWLTHTPLNVSSGMGLILLIGLDMKNGILLVEYIQQLRAEGMALRPALLLAGRTRFRPILMTSLAAILGMLPLALGIGPGAQMQQPLAIVVIGGLTANMLFTRMIIPVGYLVLERGGETAAVREEPKAVPAVAKTSA